MTNFGATGKMADFIQEKGISLTSLAENTQITYNALYASLGSRRRPLKADELLIICDFLELDPRRFIVKKGI